MSEPDSHSPQPPSALRRRVVRFLPLLAACTLALMLRAWALGFRGVIGFDETYYFILGRNLFSGHGYHLNALPHGAFPPLYPILVGVASRFTDNPRLATGIVSSLSGALLPLPLYLIALDLHSRRAAIFTAFASAVLPSLFFFASLGVPYSWKLYAGTEPLYITLFSCALASIWLFARRPGWRLAALAGFFFGLAALTRSEGPVVFSFVFLWLLLYRLCTRNIFNRRALSHVALLAAAMMLVFSPWLIYLRGLTGHWTLGPKLSAKTEIRDAFQEWFAHDNNFPFMQIHYAINDSADWMQQPYWGVSDYHRSQMARKNPFSGGVRAVLSPQYHWAPSFFSFFYKGYLPLVPPLAWFLVFLGLFFPPWNPRRFLWLTLLFANVFAMLFIAVSVGCLPRNELHLVALMTVPLGFGLSSLASAFARLTTRFLPMFSRAASPVALLAVLAVLFSMAHSGVHMNILGTRRTGSSGGAVNQPRERELAALLKTKLPPDSSLMTIKPWIAVWAGLDWRVPPLTSQEQFVTYSKARSIDYALLGPWQLGESRIPEALAPYLIDTLDYGERFYLFHFPRNPARETAR